MGNVHGFLAALSGLWMLLVSGCAVLDTDSQTHHMLAQAQARQFVSRQISVGGFEILTLTHPAYAEIMTVYIEGDGAPWPTPYYPPADPTPLKPLALGLALADPSASVGYLGRPCQYLSAQALMHCAVRYWTERRFAPEVVAAYDALLNQIKATQGNQTFRLVGYSGGGVLATLLAQRRSDIRLLVTVAAPVDLLAWQRWHQATPLSGSLDPMAAGMPRAQAVHWVGQDDRIVPTSVVAGFVAAHGGSLRVQPQADHVCCWVDNWPQLLRLTLAPE